MILACAVGGKADYIVSGDKDLLTLISYAGIPIRTAEQFLDHISNP
jgi:predicted nucleic acid-binding protein